jgi:hypothetical protein
MHPCILYPTRDEGCNFEKKTWKTTVKLENSSKTGEQQ